MSVNKISSMGTINANSNRNVNSNKDEFLSIFNNSMNQSQNDLDGIFEAASKQYNVPVNLLKSVAKTESNFNSNATSKCGAMGIMQLMPKTADALGVSDAYNPQQNIMGGAKYLSQMLDEFDGNTELAVAAYNAGPNNVRKYGGIPPFEETQNYVCKVLGNGNDISTKLASTASGVSDDYNNASLNNSGQYFEDSLAKMVLMNISRVNMSNVADGESDSIL